jgi:hypothetical protein
MELVQSGLRRLLKEELSNCVMCELNYFPFLVDMDKVFTPGADAVNIVRESLWL